MQEALLSLPDTYSINEQSVDYAHSRENLRSPNELYELACELSSAILASGGITFPKHTNPTLMNARQAYLPTFDATYSAGLKRLNHSATLLDPSVHFNAIMPITDHNNIEVSATMGSKGMMDMSIDIDPSLFGEIHIHLHTNKALITNCVVNIEKKPVFDR